MTKEKVEKKPNRIMFECEWSWVPGTRIHLDFTRGHWQAADDTRIQITPPPGNSDDSERDSKIWLVTVTLPKRRERLVQFTDEETAFRYAAEERQSRVA